MSAIAPFLLMALIGLSARRGNVPPPCKGPGGTSRGIKRAMRAMRQLLGNDVDSTPIAQRIREHFGPKTALPQRLKTSC
jgi:hypothetical protein